MNQKRLLMSFFINIIFVGLFITNLFSRGGMNESQYSLLMRELKRVILDDVDGGWPWRTRIEVPEPKRTSIPDHHHAPVGPNLTTCHVSISRGSHKVSCCPPNRESNEPIIDFQFPDPSTAVRIRRPAHKLDKDYITKYNKAVAMMKSLPYDDPRNFMRQANIHCIYCTGSYNQMHSNSLLKIHRSWLFFPFHRMMIYFHERILGSLIGDDAFGLPFWNWDNPEGMTIPGIYLNVSPLIDKQRDDSHLPPKVSDLNFNYVEEGLDTQEQIRTNLAVMYHQMISGAKKTQLFMGCPYHSSSVGSDDQEGLSCNGPGTIELAPHNTLHTWVGSNLNSERENMGSFYSAARDPIFYAHHSNIDRLWEVWRELNGHKLDIHDPEWLDSYFFFYNERSQLVRIRIRDVLDHTKLGCVYENVDNSAWINARPKPSVPPEIAREILKMKEQEENHNGLKLKARKQNFGAEARTLDETIRVQVQRPKKREEEEEVLVVYGIDVKKDSYVKFDVYVNAVDESSIGPESREFAGTFVNMLKGVRLVLKKVDVVVKRNKAILKLGISELLEDLEADGDKSIWVTLVPRGGTCVNTTVGGVRIEYIR